MSYQQSLDIQTADVTVANTTTETAIYTMGGTGIPGNTLGAQNTVDTEIQAKIGFSGSGQTAAIRAYLNGTLAAGCTISSFGTASNRGLIIRINLCGDGSSNAQFCSIEPILGYTGGVLDGSMGYGLLTQNSGNDLSWVIKVQFSTANPSTTITASHVVTSALGIATVSTPDELDDASGLIYVDSLLNGLNYTIRNDAYFYAELYHDLDFFGYGAAAGFTRGSVVGATWRDGATHNVGSNDPRFEYSGDTPLGMLINKSIETLSFSTQNALHDSNTLCWIEDGVFKSTPTNTNIFNSGGVYTGNNNVHISQIVKFNRVLTANEILAVQSALT